MPQSWSCAQATSRVFLGPIKLPAEFKNLSEQAVNGIKETFGIINKECSIDEPPTLEEIPTLNESILGSMKKDFQKKGTQIVSQIFSDDSLNEIEGGTLAREVADAQVCLDFIVDLHVPYFLN